MKYIDEFRDGAVARQIAEAIRAEAQADRRYHFMEFCGGHTHAISRYGVLELLPPNVRMIHGPGCPVCVLPIGRVDLAIRLAALNAQLRTCATSDHRWLQVIDHPEIAGNYTESSATAMFD